MVWWSPGVSGKSILSQALCCPIGDTAHLDLLQVHQFHSYLLQRKPCTVNWRACQAFVYVDVILSFISWYFSIFIFFIQWICHPSFFSDIWSDVEHACCSASDVWFRALTNFFTSQNLMWQGSNILLFGTVVLLMMYVSGVVFWSAILLWYNASEMVIVSNRWNKNTLCIHLVDVERILASWSLNIWVQPNCNVHS